MSTNAPQSFDPVWEQVFQQQEWGKYPSEHVIRFVARSFYRAPDRKAVRILDLGSGPGACTWYVAREGFSISSIDGSATAIERLKKRLAADGLSSDARVGDVVQLPWPDATFDAVIDNGCLCCNRFEMQKRAVQEVLRVLRPGGRFSSCNFTDRSWGYGIGTPVEPGGFTDIPAGPLEGKGFCSFLGRAQVDELYAPFERRSVEAISWTAEDMKHLIEMWVVTATKAG